jgi:RNA-directed DNA polymerase
VTIQIPDDVTRELESLASCRRKLPGNMDSLNSFRAQVNLALVPCASAKEPARKMTWEWFWPLVDRWIPSAKILHPHPNVRFDAIHPR